MGRQVNFYAVHSDYRALLRKAQDLGLLAIPPIVPTRVYELGQVEAVPPTQFELEAKAKFYLVPQEIPVVEVFYKELSKDQSRSFLMPHVSPVIAIGPCRREGERLYQSRLYIDAPREGPGAALIHNAYDRLSRYVRRWPKVEKRTYAGPTTMERLRNGEIRLMVLNRELEVDVPQAPIRTTSPKLEWIEIPAGEFTQGLTDEQRTTIQQRLYEAYGIGELEPELQEWIPKIVQEPMAYSRSEVWKREVLKGGSPAVAYRDAMWALGRIPEARTRFLPTFYMARFPITHAQADYFYRSAVAQGMGWDKKKRPIGSEEAEDRPEMFMLWEQAQALAHWLGGRLPTPLEWEKAARGSDGRLYPWGDTWNPGAGHFRTSEAHQGGDPQKRRGRLTAVDAYPEGASPYGVLDMVGNLGEWYGLSEQNDVGYMGYSIKEMGWRSPWFWALPMHQRGSTRRQGMWYVGCRPVLEAWGRRLWPGYRPELD
jgi:formylglycine-generating enzyme required for sulfatase activity